MTEVFLIATAIVLAGVTVDSILLRIRRKELLKSVVMTTMENMSLKKQLDNAPMTPSESEGFIKFLSESRDWAFTYIEDVQKAIEDLRLAMQTEDAEAISAKYNELISFLPEKMNND